MGKRWIGVLGRWVGQTMAATLGQAALVGLLGLTKGWHTARDYGQALLLLGLAAAAALVTQLGGYAPGQLGSGATYRQIAAVIPAAEDERIRQYRQVRPAGFAPLVALFAVGTLCALLGTLLLARGA